MRTLPAVHIAHLMLLLEVPAVSIAFPEIRRSISSDFSSLQGVIVAFSLTLAAFPVTVVSLADRMSRYGQEQPLLPGGMGSRDEDSSRALAAVVPAAAGCPARLAGSVSFDDQDPRIPSPSNQRAIENAESNA